MMIAMPAVASASASHWTGWTRSPVARIEKKIVKNTWLWITSEARPGVIRPFIAKNSRPNWPTPMNRP